MSYVFENVGNKKELWTEIGFKDQDLKIIPYSKYHLWCVDKANGIYLFQIGNDRGNTPNFFDMSYKKRIIRIAVVESIETDENRAVYIYNIQRISIPRSVWEERDEIVKNAEAGIKEILASLKNNASLLVNCEPECVDADYNGQ
jgi:hypothetical protein